MKLFTKPMTKSLTEPLKDGGFTFIELIMTIVILGILAAYATPKFSSTSEFSVAGAAEVVASDITYTQREAMSTRQRLSVRIPATLPDPIYDYAYDTAAATGKPRDLTEFNASLSVTAVSPSGTTDFLFNSLGEPVGITAQAAITVSDGNVTKTITIEPYTGKVTIN